MNELIELDCEPEDPLVTDWMFESPDDTGFGLGFVWFLAVSIAVGATLFASFVLAWPQSSVDSETADPLFRDTWNALDELASHPFDPDLPMNVEGVTDDEIAALDAETVEMVLSEKVVELAMLSDSPRHTFEVGRVAFVHDQDELAFDMLSLAAESGSAPAYMYVADFFADDLPAAREYAQASLDLGFAPASELLEKIDAMGAGISPSPDYDVIGSPIETSPSAESAGATVFRFEDYHQPELLQGMSDQHPSLTRLTPRLPASTPDYMERAEGEVLVHRMVTTLYACHLAIALGDKAKEEVSVYLPEGSPRLARMIDANVTSSARIRSTTDDMLLLNTGKGIAKRLSVVGAIIEGGREILKDEITLDSLADNGGTILKGFVGQDKRNKETDDFSEAVKDQAMIDAIRLQDAYYTGNADQVISIYSGLSKFVLTGGMEL